MNRIRKIKQFNSIAAEKHFKKFEAHLLKNSLKTRTTVYFLN